MNNQLLNPACVHMCLKAFAMLVGLLLHCHVHALSVVDTKLDERADETRVTLLFDQALLQRLGCFRAG